MSKLYRPPHKRPRQHRVRPRKGPPARLTQKLKQNRAIGQMLADHNMLTIPVAQSLAEEARELLGYPKIELGPGEEHDD